MKITTKLTLEYLKRSKRKSIIILKGITIATMLVTVVLIFISSFQKYLINVVRNESDWEAEFIDIKYSDSLQIKEDRNIKEISLYYDYGLSDENISKIDLIKCKMHVKGYDLNALKNANINLVEGRLPESCEEIILLDETGINIGDEIEITLEATLKKYKVVGLVNYYKPIERPTNMEMSNWYETESIAITFLDKDVLEDDTLVNVRILTNNINKIYKTTNDLAESLNIYDIENVNRYNNAYKDEDMTDFAKSFQEKFEEMIQNGEINDSEEEQLVNKEKIKYNTTLLTYYGVLEGNNTFKNILITVGITFVLIISIVGGTIIYNSFEIIYKERIKEFGILSSIGMSKKQRENMLLKESLILGTIGIILGLFLGIVFSHILLQTIQVFIDNFTNDNFSFFINDRYMYININKNIEFQMSIPINILLIIFSIIYIIVFISCILPMRKINKISAIEAIKGIKQIKIKQKIVKTSKYIYRLFGQEGELAYKNIKIEKRRYKAIVVSLTTSLIVYLVISSFLSNLYPNYGEGNKYNDYLIENVNYEEIEDVINYLEKQNLINRIFCIKYSTASK